MVITIHVEIPLECVHCFEVVSIELHYVFVGLVGLPLGDVVIRTEVVFEIEIILVYLMGAYVSGKQRLLVCLKAKFSSSEVVVQALVFTLPPDLPLLHHIEKLHFIRHILSTIHSLLVFKGFLHIHFFLKLHLLRIGVPGFFHLDQNIIIVIVVIDIDLNAIFVVCAGKHEFPCKDLFLC